MFITVSTQISRIREGFFTNFKKEFDVAYAADPTYKFPMLSDLWISLTAAFFWHKAETPVKKLCWWFMYRVCKEQENESLRIFKAEKASKQFFKAVYYSFNVCFGYYIGRQTDFLPWSLGGKPENSLGNMWNTYPVDNNDYHQILKFYYLITFGYHSCCIFHLYQTHMAQPRSDLSEMILHHFATLILYFSSFIVGALKVGLVMSFLHDIADISVSLCKIFFETRLKKLTYITWTMMVVSWGWTRLYVFPIVIWKAMYKSDRVLSRCLDPNTGKFDKIKCEVIGIKDPICILLCLLLVLHVYWFYLFLATFYQRVLTNNDSQGANRLTSHQNEITDEQGLKVLKEEMLRPYFSSKKLKD